MKEIQRKQQEHLWENIRTKSIFTKGALNIDGLTCPIKRHRHAEWVKNQDPSTCCLQETLITNKDKHRLKVKRYKKISSVDREQKQAAVAILTSDKIDFKAKIVTIGK